MHLFRRGTQETPASTSTDAPHPEKALHSRSTPLVATSTRLGITLFIFLFLIGLAQSALAIPHSTNPAGAAPLPNACQDVSGVSPLCCVSGYVFASNGQPIAGVPVTVTSSAGPITHTQTLYFDDDRPAHYYIDLSSAGLTPGDWITVSTTYSNMADALVYQVITGGQQVDLVLATTGGSGRPIATLHHAYPNPSRRGIDRVLLAGHGRDTDESGNAITAWEWSSSLDGLIATSEDASLIAASLSAGKHVISYRVQDDEGVWSEVVTRTLTIQPNPRPRIYFAPGNGVGTTTARATAVATADFDNDGDLDIVATTGPEEDYELILWENDGTPFVDQWPQHDIGAAPSHLMSVSTGDFDGDGHVDIVTGGEKGNPYEVVVWRNDGTPFDGPWTSTNVGRIADNASVCVAVDLDKDGDPDLVCGVGWREFYSVIAWENDGTPWDGGWIRHNLARVSDGAGQPVLVDLDNDGDLDIGVVSVHNVYVLENDGTPWDAIWEERQIGTVGSPQQTWRLGAADLDQDGDVDLVSSAQREADYEIIAWENDGTPFSGLWPMHNIGASSDHVYPVVVADFDLDGDDDVATGSYSGEDFELIVWENDGNPFDGLWPQHDMAAPGDTIFDLAGADLDGDADTDLVGAVGLGADYQVVVWENRPVVPAPPSQPDIAVTPPTISVTLNMSTTASATLLIANTGDDILSYTIAAQYTFASRQQSRTPAAGLLENTLLDPQLEAVLADGGQADYLVILRQQADLSGAYAITDWTRRGRYVMQRLFAVAEHSQKDLRALLARQKALGHASEVRPHHIINAISVRGDRTSVNALVTQSEVAAIQLAEPIMLPPLPMTPTAAPQDVPWNLDRIRADQVWAMDITGENTTVGIVDTGVDASHPALANSYRGTATGNHNYNWYDPDGILSEPDDPPGHGTAIAGIVVGNDGVGHQVGVAPGTRWIAAQACDDRYCSNADILASLEWMLAPCPVGVQPGDPTCDAARRPQIINASWGSCQFSQAYHQAINALVASGIIPVAAAGNLGNCNLVAPVCSSVNTPAAYAESTAVGATTPADTVASFSVWGPAPSGEIKPDVSAPGVLITSTLPGGRYGIGYGTSMAAPHVAGAAALILSAQPDLIGNVQGVKSLLQNTALPIPHATGCRNDGPGDVPNNAAGYGRIDVKAAIDTAKPVVPWLDVDRSSGSIAPGAQVTITVIVSAAGLGAGTHYGVLHITSNDPDENPWLVPVTLTVNPPAPPASELTVGNVGANSAAIAWLTGRAVVGGIRYGTDPQHLPLEQGDDRGSGPQAVHMVTLANLQPNTTYYFDLLLDGTVDDNHGRHYMFTTGPSLGLPSMDTIYGQVLNPDGNPATSALVVVRLLDNDGLGSIGRSAPLLAVTSEDGFYTIGLNKARLWDSSGLFRYSQEGSDSVEVTVVDGSTCRFARLVDTDTSYPAPSVTLDCSGATWTTLGQGWSAFVPAQPLVSSDLLQTITAQGGRPESIARWANEGWEVYPITMTQPFPLEPGQAYLIHNLKRGLVTLPGAAFPVDGRTVALNSGHNFVTVPGGAINLTARHACRQIDEQGGAALEIFHWLDSVGNWEGYRCGATVGNFALDPGQAYMIRVGQPSTWRPRPVNLTRVLLPDVSVHSSSRVSSSGVGTCAEPCRSIGQVRVTDLGDKGFAVSWTTDQPTTGMVRYGTQTGLERTARDRRGASYRGLTHLVLIEEAIPGASYLFDVITDGTVDDNNGQHYAVTLGPTLDIPATDTVLGRVLLADGTNPATDAVVYVTLEDADGLGSGGTSAPLAAVTDANGTWRLNLAAARAVDGNSFFTYSDADRLHIEVEAASAGATSATFTVAQTNDENGLPTALPDLSLDGSGR